MTSFPYVQLFPYVIFWKIKDMWNTWSLLFHSTHSTHHKCMSKTDFWSPKYITWIQVNIVKQIHNPQNINRESLIVQSSDSKGRGKLFSLKSYHRWSGVRGGCHAVVRASVTASGAPNSPSHQGEGGVGPRGEHHSGHGRFHSTGARQRGRSGTGWGRDLGHWRGGLVGLWQVQQHKNPTSMPHIPTPDM